jgi:hypothetical protein
MEGKYASRLDASGINHVQNLALFENGNIATFE